MSLIDLLKHAKISKVAIIDDDLRKTITQSDISRSSPNDDDLNSLSDIADPDRQEFLQFLTAENLPRANVDEMLAALENDDVRGRAPDRYRVAAERVITQRSGLASRVILVKSWLEDLGILKKNITVYTKPEDVVLTKTFDLILIDYFLVGDSKEQTVPLIKELLAAHESRRQPLLVILMSSHEAELQADFSELRPKLRRTSSRFRLMLKPTISAEDKILWHYTFEQLATERNAVIPIEKFIQAWSDKLKMATTTLTDGLWSLDAHAFSILTKTAESDHLSMDEYFGDVLSRRVLAEVEQIDFPESETRALTTALLPLSGASFSSEIGDSRAALRKIVVDIAWHRKSWWKPKTSFPRSETQKQFEWLKRNVRFGTVLKHKKTKEYFVNITQPCDIAHIKLADIKSNHLLLIPGTEDALHGTVQKGNKYAYSSSFDKGAGCVNIQWSLRQPRTPSIEEFIKEVNKYEVVGQMRQDQTQGISAQFASLTSRVATIRSPSFGKFYGYVFGVTGMGEQAMWELKSTRLIAHTYPAGDKQMINFNVAYAHQALNPLGAIPNLDSILRKLVEGVEMKMNSGGLTTIIQAKLKCSYASEAINLEDFQSHSDLVKNKADAATGCYFLLFWPEEN